MANVRQLLSKNIVKVRNCMCKKGTKDQLHHHLKHTLFHCLLCKILCLSKKNALAFGNISMKISVHLLESSVRLRVPFTCFSCLWTAINVGSGCHLTEECNSFADLEEGDNKLEENETVLYDL